MRQIDEAFEDMLEGPQVDMVLDVERQTNALPEQARAIGIVDDEGFGRAALFLASVIKPLRAEVEDVFGPIVKAAHKAHALAVSQRKKVEAPMIEAEMLVKQRMAFYAAERERRVREEAALRAAEARKAEEEQRLREAEALEAAGEPEAATAVLEAPNYTPAPVPEPKLAAAGVAVRETWAVECVDLPALVAAVMTGAAPMVLLGFNQLAANAMLRGMKGEMQKFPGLKVTRSVSVAARSI